MTTTLFYSTKENEPSHIEMAHPLKLFVQSAFARL